MSTLSRMAQLSAVTAFAAFWLTVTPAAAIDFGDDNSQWSKDGECDDPRFTGPGMTTTPLLDEDILHDATDCQQAYNADRVHLHGKEAPKADVNFGDDSSKWSKDGECDDPRFTGPGMTTTPLLQEDSEHDATDCQQAYNSGRITLAGSASGSASGSGSESVDFGDDSSKWSKDGECDDPRFTGAGMTTTPLLDADIKHDATDCKTAFDAGKLTVK